MATFQKLAGPFFVGLYVCVLTTLFGMVLLDILYAGLVPQAQFAFTAIADLLLIVAFVTLLCALAAIAFSWSYSTARNLLIASVLVTVFEFLIPLFFTQSAVGLSIGPWLRIIPTGVASILALIGLVKYCREK